MTDHGKRFIIAFQSTLFMQCTQTLETRLFCSVFPPLRHPSLPVATRSFGRLAL